MSGAVNPYGDRTVRDSGSPPRTCACESPTPAASILQKLQCSFQEATRWLRTSELRGEQALAPPTVGLSRRYAGSAAAAFKRDETPPTYPPYASLDSYRNTLSMLLWTAVGTGERSLPCQHDRKRAPGVELESWRRFAAGLEALLRVS